MRNGNLLRHTENFPTGGTLQHPHLEGRRDFPDRVLGRLVHLQDLPRLGHYFLRQRVPVGRVASGGLLVDEKIGQAGLW